ncbi:MAG: hypothetical protein M3063_09240 [Actinomycetota bacterium]|nr:hypothetical protein [Actinomycetota bacterium]
MDAASLAADMVIAPDESLVRYVADWIDRATTAAAVDLATAPPLDGRRHVDALIAASAAQVARLRGLPAPAWTNEPQRRTDNFWYPGPPSLFPNALVHSPLAFRSRGVFVEAASLRSV